MFEAICTLPLPADLLVQAVHPSVPLISAGLASGYVYTYRLPSLEDSPAPPRRPSPPKCSRDGPRPRRSSLSSNGDFRSVSPAANGYGTVDLAWKTKRHKLSTRALAFDASGDVLVSAGFDGIVKVARTETGHVTGKVAVPGAPSDTPCLLHAPSPQNLLLGTDGGHLHFYDLRAAATSVGAKPQATYTPHGDYVSSLCSLPPGENTTSGFPKQFVSTGGASLAVTDLRKGVLVTSDEVTDEELLSSVVVGDRVLVGGSGGVVRYWERGVWREEIPGERLIVDYVKKGPAPGGESLDVLTTLPRGVGRNRSSGGTKGPETLVGVGMGDGRIKIFGAKRRKVLAELRHDEMEGVVGLAFECQGRMVSGGGQSVKVWTESSLDEDGDSESVNRLSGSGGNSDVNSDGEEVGEEEEDSEEEIEEPKRKRRRKGSSRNQPKTTLSFRGLD